ncbi:sensor histidine kinase [Paenibacillus sp. GCM10027626]|uniref:sensor histidine kinase n=1 Tax=Paenibacillus sp. GCM10027626 TaxID=3273411 RepID=UPI00363CD7F0
MLNSMRSRMVFLVLLMNLVLTAAVALVTLQYNFMTTKRTAERYNRQLAYDTMESLDIKNKKYGEVSLQILTSPLLQERLPGMLESDPSGSESLVFKSELMNFLNQYYYTSDEIESIRVWFGHDKVISVGQPPLKNNGRYEDQSGYRLARKSSTLLAWIANPNGTLSQWHIISQSQNKQNRSSNISNQVIGAVEINMKPDRLLESTEKLKVIPGVRFSYFNQEQMLLFYYSGQNDVGDEELTAILANFKNSGRSEESFQRQSYRFFAEKSYLNMYLVISYPIERFSQYVLVAGAQIAMIAIVILLISILGVLYISNMTTRPLKTVLQGIRAFGEGSLGIRIPATNVREIDMIGNGLNRMAKQIENLLRDRVRYKQIEHQLELKSKQAELRALRNQINPHFLFNTLQSIHSVAIRKTGAETEINQMIIHLSKLLRESIYNIKNVIYVEEELNNLWAYVELQRYRFGDRFQVKWQIDYRSLNYKVPCLILQPIMENAIQHGVFHADKEVVRIVVDSEFCGGEWRLTIEDDGCGMDKHTLERLLYRLREGAGDPAPDKGGVGLYNTHNRLLHEFGHRYEMEIVSEPDRGTRVRIRIRFDDETQL